MSARTTFLLCSILASRALAADCHSLIGDWDWFTGGQVTFTAQKTVIYNRVASGAWTCTDSNRDGASIRWNTGFVDSVYVNGDRISGKNNQGIPVSGARHGSTVQPPSTESKRPSSPPSPVGAKVVMASGLLQQCLGIFGGRMTRGPSTQAYCKQLPRAALYDQAGARFQAGDRAGAAKLAQEAAEAGNAQAQLRLAMMYEGAEGVARSTKSALAWYSRAAAQGEPASQMEMGGYYEEGDGVPENCQLAARLYEASALQGWTKGQFAYGRCFQFGIGVPQDRQQAIAWFQKAAAQGNAQAEYFARHLRDPLNNIGFRNEIERDIVLAGKLRFGGSVLGGDPAGVTFHNSAQRALWLMGQRNRLDKEEAEIWRQIRQREYNDCRRAGKDNCIIP